MTIHNTTLKGLHVIASDLYMDDRGFFNRIFCQKELACVKSDIVIEQINHSMTKSKGAIRGMHFQHLPFAEMKIVRCIKGSIFDVAVDLRKDSSTFLKWHGEILSASNMKALIIPEGFAHGFQALENNIEMIYLHTQAYHKEAESGVRFDDPAVGIVWPLPVTDISEKDCSYPLLDIDFRGTL